MPVLISTVVSNRFQAHYTTEPGCVGKPNGSKQLAGPLYTSDLVLLLRDAVGRAGLLPESRNCLYK
jgi:hypothetical protein